MGKEVLNENLYDYNRIIEELEQRRKIAEQLTPELVEYLLELVASGVDHWSANGLVLAKVNELILNVAEEDIEVARGAFGDDAANITGAAIIAEASGDLETARRLRDFMRESAPMVSFCGAGSCGLEKVTLTAKEEVELGAKPGQTKVKDKDRCCIKCGKKEIIYIFDSSEVTKKCRGCGDKETKKSSVGSSTPPSEK